MASPEGFCEDSQRAVDQGCAEYEAGLEEWVMRDAREDVEPLWCRVCPVCGRQLVKATDQCHGEFPKTVYVVREEAA